MIYGSSAVGRGVLTAPAWLETARLCQRSGSLYFIEPISADNENGGDDLGKPNTPLVLSDPSLFLLSPSTGFSQGRCPNFNSHVYSAKSRLSFKLCERYGFDLIRVYFSAIAWSKDSWRLRSLALALIGSLISFSLYANASILVVKPIILASKRSGLEPERCQTRLL